MKPRSSCCSRLRTSTGATSLCPASRRPATGSCWSVTPSVSCPRGHLQQLLDPGENITHSFNSTLRIFLDPGENITHSFNSTLRNFCRVFCFVVGVFIYVIFFRRGEWFYCCCTGLFWKFCWLVVVWVFGDFWIIFFGGRGGCLFVWGRGGCYYSWFLNKKYLFIYLLIIIFIFLIIYYFLFMHSTHLY